ncbi:MULTISPECIES: hypothetical protein [Pseudomonas]|uniref:Uncharacterized protein n=1 Tax=Pseudomonas asplenii TaxID=53407 RepID=A0A0N0E533_9PSED|nr:MULTISPECIES: hypothetical protein [Pseudomonas]KPA91961.1 hypothetical protein PF66_01544 [Pseudomonas fuscovaginae]KPA95866.1 hypothetical protein PF70_04118 [Pseudomonas fuscovaginae]
MRKLMSKTHHSLLESLTVCWKGQKNDGDFYSLFRGISMAKGFALYMTGMTAVMATFAVAVVMLLH